jgi:tetratricopeptide (TPR) repeat protein
LRSLSPNDPRILGALARASLFKGQLARDSAWEDRAAEHVERALAVAPEDPEVMLAAADLERILGHHEEALALYARVLAADPSPICAHVGASWAHERRGDLEQAELAARAAIAADPNDWRGHSRLGGFMLNRGAYTDAIAPWTRVVEIAPDHARGWSSLGSALFQVDRFEEALAAFEHSIRLQPTAVAILNAAGTLHYLGRHAESIIRFEQAIALHPSDARAWGNLGSACCSIEGMAERSRVALEHAIVLMREHLDRHADDAVGWSWLAFWLAECGRIAEATEARDRAIELAPERIDTLPGMAGTFELLGDDERAIGIYCDRVRRGAGLRGPTSDPALRRLRGTPGWQRVIEAARERDLRRPTAPAAPGGSRSR